MEISAPYWFWINGDKLLSTALEVKDVSFRLKH
jgi:hypothetical protein